MLSGCAPKSMMARDAHTPVIFTMRRTGSVQLRMVDDLNEEHWMAADVPAGWKTRRKWRHGWAVAADSAAQRDHRAHRQRQFSISRHTATSRPAREQVGRSFEVIQADAPYGPLKNEYLHEELAIRPAAMLDGHSRSLPAAPSWWLDVETRWRPPGGARSSRSGRGKSVFSCGLCSPGRGFRRRPAGPAGGLWPARAAHR